MPIRILTLVCVLLLSASGTASAYGAAQVLCTMNDPAIIESSGIVASLQQDGVYFTHNDSGDGPRLFAFDESCTVLAEITVTGATAIDWEDIAHGRAQDGSARLYVGDIGNNNRNRTDLVIYEVPEPVVNTNAAGQQISVPVIASYPYVYLDAPQDAEGLMVDPRDGAIYIAGKTQTGVAAVYRIEPSSSPFDALTPFVARPIAHIAYPSTRAIGPQATGADIAPDGSRLVIRTYQEAFEWTLVGDIATSLRALPVTIPLPPTIQGEAIAYSSDGSSLITTTEGVGRPVHLLPGA
jgi:hypothetical protein